MHKNHLQVHGHRGCRGLFPENTLPAFLHALQLGVDVLEMDVVLSSDEQVVVAHEPWLSATLGLSPTGQPIDPQLERQLNIYQLPYAAIRQSVVGILPHTSFPEQQMVATYRPLLTEVLHTTEKACLQLGRPPIQYSIEVKSSPETVELFHPGPTPFITAVVACVPPAVLPRTTILSFDIRVLQAARQLYPTLRLCLLVEHPFVPQALFESLGFTPDVLGPDYRLLTKQLLVDIRELQPKLEVVPWTVNEPADMARLASWYINGITTDYPNRLLHML